MSTEHANSPLDIISDNIYNFIGKCFQVLGTQVERQSQTDGLPDLLASGERLFDGLTGGHNCIVENTNFRSVRRGIYVKKRFLFTTIMSDMMVGITVAGSTATVRGNSQVIEKQVYLP